MPKAKEHARPRLMNVVQDGIIEGAVSLNRQQCQSCGHHTRCIYVVRVELPEGVDLGWTKIAKRINGVPIEGEWVEWIGIGCGCYARFHRQVVHIELKRTMKEEFTIDFTKPEVPGP